LADTNTVKKKNNLEAKSDCPNTILWFSKSLRHKASVDISGLHLNNLGAPRLLKTPENNEKLRRFFFLDLYNLRINYDLLDCWTQEQFFSSPLSCWKKKKKKNLSTKKPEDFFRHRVQFFNSKNNLLCFYIF
jgi:hypothetical protein